MSALAHIPVGVLVDRIKAQNPWADYIWQPRSVLLGEPETAPWTVISSDTERTTFYAGSALVEFFKSSTAHYRDNLLGDGAVWVILTPTESEPPYKLFMVTADPTEGEAMTEAGSHVVDTVPMPPQLRAMLEDFVAEHHVEEQFFKRKRDRANPDALGRRGRVGQAGEGTS